MDCGLVRRVSNSIDKIQVERKIQGDRLKLGYTEKEGQEREILHWQHGPTALTQLPDHVIAERCQNAAEKEHAHQAESKKKRRRGGRKGTKVKKGRELRGQFRKADANVTMASVENPEPNITLSFQFTHLPVMLISSNKQYYAKQHQPKHVFFLSFSFTLEVIMFQDALIFVLQRSNYVNFQWEAEFDETTTHYLIV